MSTSEKQKLLQKRVLDPTSRNSAFRRLRDESTQIVPGHGNLDALIMIVGEAPGEDEDREGKPFVGPAGQLLTQMLVAAQVDRTQCWVTNLVKYRPIGSHGGNRQPTWNERNIANRYLSRELNVIRPRVVVLCGRIAFNAFKPGAITRNRGHAFTVPGSKGRRAFLPVLHPAACLRDPESEIVTRRDLAVCLPALLGDFELAIANGISRDADLDRSG